MAGEEDGEIWYIFAERIVLGVRNVLFSISTVTNLCENRNIQSSALGSSLRSNMVRICSNWDGMLRQVNIDPLLPLTVPTS